MQNYISSGDSIDVVLPEGTKAGVPYIHGTLIGIPVTEGDGVNFQALQLRGIYRLPKANAAITAGAKVYWNATDSNLVTTASGNTLVGAATAAAGTGTTEVDVVLTNAV